jgi:hypothetical protein
VDAVTLPDPPRVAIHTRRGQKADLALSGKRFVHVVVIMDSQHKLFQVVGALATASRFPRGLHRRQEECDQNTDDRDHDQELDESEPFSLFWNLGARNVSHESNLLY